MKILLSLAIALITTISAIAQDKTYLHTLESKAVNGKNEVTHSEVELTDKYFDIELQSAKQGEYHVATKDLIKSIAGQPFHMKTVYLVDQGETKAKHFPSTSEFLNFMDKCGYEMVSQKQEKYKVLYTFKRKI
jgi:hypothetical protein